jgi:predicted acyltransferase
MANRESHFPFRPETGIILDMTDAAIQSNTPSGAARPDDPAVSRGTRLASIDALRGFDMFWITGGGTMVAALAGVWENSVTRMVREQLRHVDWQGFHFEDLIYPLFLTLIGVVLPFSLARRTERDQSRGRLYLHFLTRSLLLVLLGSIPGGVLQFTHWPHMGGVLQHIGLCYLFAAPIVLHTSWRTRLVMVTGFLVLYWLALIWVPIPGHGAGVFTEEGNLAAYLDRPIISGRLWNEGPSSTPSGICLILAGSLAGQWLRSSRSGGHKAAGLAWAGVGLIVLGYAWSYSVPMIKRIVWSSSYVTFALGWSLLLLAIFYWVIDVKGYKKWAFPFVVIGMNAITIYFLQQIVDFGHIAQLLFGGVATYAGTLRPGWEPFVLAAGRFVLVWLFLWMLYRHKVFFKL